MDTWEADWRVGFPAETVDQLLLALVTRDLVHGASFDVEAISDGTELALDFTAGDELDGELYQLLLSAEIGGSDNREMVKEFTEQMLEELVVEAEELAGQRVDLDSRPLSELAFRSLPENDERWDLVVPDWLAPDGAEVPFGFRPFVEAEDIAWPDDETLDAHGRVILVPFAGTAHLFGVPAPSTPEDQEEHD
jgi:hypothetical protein